MSVKKIIVYFVIPLTVTMTLIGMYFSGNTALQEIVSPRMPGMNPNMGREFGVLENLQNLVLLAMFAVACIGIRRKTRRLEKIGFAFLAAFTLFIFLEEIDYGLHIYEYVKDIKWNESAKTRNLHNVGDRTDVAKTVVDMGTALLFFVVPMVFANSRIPLLRYVTPDRYSILTVLAMVMARTLAHGLKDRGVGTQGTIHSNLSEFRELITYYVFMLYVIEVVLRRTWESPLAAVEEAPSNSEPPA